jgi:hypothetical protein
MEQSEGNKMTTIKFLDFVLLCLLMSTYSSAQNLAYFGQEPPGSTPLRFPPPSLLANSSWFWHGSPNFSPDLMEMYWVKYTHHTGYDRMEMAFVEVEDTQWTSMQVPVFANLNYDENNPFCTVSGDTIYFVSQRPGGFIFYTTRTLTGWSQPLPLNIPIPANTDTGWQFSITKNKTIYLELWTNNGTNPPDIYRSKYINGQYTLPEDLGTTINTDYNEFSPYIDPDERFIIFVSNRPGGYGFHDLYISSKNQDDTWNDPINLGPDINSDFEDGAPYISPDELYFFFTTQKEGDLGYNPYWVDAQVVYDLITEVPDNIHPDKPITFQLLQNYPNPFNPTTTIKYQIPELSFVTLKVYDVLGNEIKTLVNEEKPAGSYEIGFDGTGLPSGVYFYRLQAENFVETKKMVSMK